MGKLTFKRNGTLLSKLRSSGALRLVLMPSAALIAMAILSGCQTISSTETAAQCSAWRSITYSGKKDTPETVKQVRVHNRTGQNLGCWK